MKPPLETAVLGGGCFWCTEALMAAVSGVVSVTSGYAGGTTRNPTYRQVCTGATGHAEAVRIQFDAAVVSYAGLLRIFMAVHHPTKQSVQEMNGGQYRSVVFYNGAGQKETAKAVIDEMQAYFEAPVLTEVSPLTAFYGAEPHHRDYYKTNPSKAYCQTVIAPKLAGLRRRFLSHVKLPFTE